MTTNSVEPARQPTATVYQFPLRGRFAAGQDAKLNESTAPRVAITGWYHDAAIDDSRRAGK